MRVLFVGETYYVNETHIKGVDSFQQSRYVDESTVMLKALRAEGFEVDHMPAHMVADAFPFSVEDLKEYGCVFISDVGAKSFLLGSETTMYSRVVPNRLAVLEEYVRNGGGLCMIGGYMSFGGFEGKANYAGTPMETLLPVTIQAGDDRREAPEGEAIRIEAPEHPLFKGLPSEWPVFLGYNRLEAKPGTLLASCHGDAFIAAWDYGKGRSMAFASDCAPHWGPVGFVEWECYNTFWGNAARYLTKES